MAADLVYGLRLTADGSGLISVVKTSKNEIDGLGNSNRKAASGARRLTDETARMERGMVAAHRATGILRRELVALVGAYGLKEAIDSTIGSFASFQQGMLNVASVAGATDVEMRALSEAALQAAGATRFDTSGTTAGLYSLSSAGQSAAEQMASLLPVLNFATAAQGELGQAAELVSGSLKTFELGADQATRVADVFTASIGASRLNIGRLDQALRNGAPTAAAFGQGLEGTTAALAVLTNILGTGMRAGSGMAAMFREMSDQARTLGITMQDGEGKFLPLVAIIRQLEEAGWDSTRAVQTFGAEAGPALSILLSQGSDALEAMEAKLQSSGQAAATAAKQLDGLRGDVDQLASAWDVLTVRLGATAEGPSREFVQSLTADVRSATENLESLVETAGSLAEVAAIFGTARLAAFAFGRVLTSNVGAVVGLRLMAAIAPAAAARLAVVGTAATAAAAGIGLMNRALALAGGPVGLAVLAAAGLYELAKMESEADKAARAHRNSIRDVNELLDSGADISRKTAQAKLEEARARREAAAGALAEAEAAAQAHAKRMETMQKDWALKPGGQGIGFVDVNRSDMNQEVERLRLIIADNEATIRRLDALLAGGGSGQGGGGGTKPGTPSAAATALATRREELERELAQAQQLYQARLKSADLYEETAKKIAAENAVREIVNKAKQDNITISETEQKQLRATILAIADYKDKVDQVGQAEKERAEFARDVQSAVDAAKAEAERAYAATVEDIQRRYAALPKTYDQAIRAAEKWRSEALAGLDRSKAGYAGFAAEVDDVYRNMLSGAYDAHLAKSREWQDGVTRGLRQVLDEAGDMAQGFEDLTVGAFQRSEDAFVEWKRTGKLQVGELFDFIGDEFVRLAYRAAIVKPYLEPLADAFGSWTQSLFSGQSSAIDAGGGPVQVAHSGGVIGGPNAFQTRNVTGSLFDGAPRFHDGGQIGAGEVPFIGKVGEVVGWPDQMRAAFGSNISFEIIDQRGADAPAIETEHSQGANGEDRIRMWVRDEVRSGHNRGDFDSAMQTNYGVKRAPTVRRS